ncbi:hypothetical protein J6590_061807, partial [Homalodisca vitripennis]
AAWSVRGVKNVTLSRQRSEHRALAKHNLSRNQPCLRPLWVVLTSLACVGSGANLRS